MRIAFITNICPHYRIKTFETISRYFDTEYYFFSAGDEWYWQQQHGVKMGDFKYEYLPGWRLGKTRFTPSLLLKLWRGKYDVYIKCINGRFALPFTFLIAHLKHRPFVLWTGIWIRLQTPFHRLFYPVTRYIYRNADAIVVYGEHVKRFLEDEGVLPERIFIAAHAVDNDAYNFQVSQEDKSLLYQRLGVEPQDKIILYLGRLEQVKGLSYLLDAFSKLHDKGVVLVIAGTGSEEHALKKMVHENGLEQRVRFVGYVPADEAITYYSIAWIYVLPSITTPDSKELWGLVINEAMNQGVPVVTTDAVGAAAGGLIQDGINGFIVPERDSDALYQRLQDILNDPQLREKLGREARHNVADWNNDRMVMGFQQAIEFVL